MNGKQYNNIIAKTAKHSMEKGDNLETVRKIFKNMGVAFPHGKCKKVLDTLKTNDYMAWRNYDIKEAMERANNGTATIAIGEDRVMIVPANDAVDNELVSSGDNDLILNITPETSALEVSSLRFYSYSNGGTGGGAGDGGAGDGGAGNGGTGGGNSGSGTGGDSGGQGLLTTPIQFVESLILLEVGEEMDAPQYLTTIDDITSYQLRWTSSNENVATVNLYSGHICAEGVGLATITLSIAGTQTSASFNVKVVGSPTYNTRWPLSTKNEYPITSGFRTTARPDHDGVDMSAPLNTPIYAIYDGIVSKVTDEINNPLEGISVRIDHDFGEGKAYRYLRSYYLHMNQAAVSSNTQVTKGTIIGYVNNTGSSQGNHLHLGIRYKNDPFTVGGSFYEGIDFIDPEIILP